MNALEADIRLRQGDFTLAANFSAPGDGITALFGPSGSGKSTLLAALAGLKKLESGRIMLKGRVCAGAGLHVPPHRRGFGLVFQEARLFPHLTIRRNIAYAASRAPRSHLRLEEVAEFFDIASLLDRPVNNLSGGEKSRVALARALVSMPDYLLLDEPFAALDGARRRNFIDVLLAAHRRFKIPMLVVTHNIDDAAALASHMVAIEKGRLVTEGALAAVAQQAGFQALLDRRDIGAVLAGDALRGAGNVQPMGYWLRADHVLLAAERPGAISARNILEGRVTALRGEAGEGVLVTLETKAGPVLARLTDEAVRDLALAPGKPAWALVKAHAI
jgi:molybdate transport system ATP-binding protein